MSSDPDVDSVLAEMRARRDLRARFAAGHQLGCQCMSRPGLPCRELRRIVGWETVERIWREVRNGKT